MNYKKKFLAVGAFCGVALLSNSIYALENTDSIQIQSKAQETLVSDIELSATPVPTTVKNENSIVDNIEIPFFETVKQGVYSNKVVIFVGGVNDTFHFWDKYIELLKNKDITILGYEGVGGKGSHPHNVEYMEQNAQIIAEGIKNLKEQGFSNIDIYAHSLGGVVTKRSLHILAETEDLKEYSNLSFTAISSPLGGFDVATPSKYIPFFRPITKFLKFAMAGDISPVSNFFHSISKPLPKTINTKMIESLDDPVAQPKAAAAKERYEKVASTFDNRIIVNGNNSHEFASEPKNLEDQGVQIFNPNFDKEKILTNIANIKNGFSNNKETIQFTKLKQ